MPQQNYYPGINPHLNSILQSDGGGWESFHANFIGQLGRELDLHLPENYYAVDEKSLQIGKFDTNTEERHFEKIRTNRPDVMVIRENESPARITGATSARAPTLELPVDTDFVEFDDENDLLSITVYHVDAGRFPGKPVTRFELLSPANKPSGAYHERYLLNRQRSLMSSLRLVEIDLLHETRPLLRNHIPDYTQQDVRATPYAVLVSDPRPGVRQGKTRVFGFGLDEPLPVITVPLDEQDTIDVDFNQVYQQTVTERRIFLKLIRYDIEPERIETYNQRERDFIRQKMKDIAAGEL
jgi:hypothetical protein